MTTATDPREAARDWIAETIKKHLRPELSGECIRRVAAEMEEEAYTRNMAIEKAVELAVEWCEERNES